MSGLDRPGGWWIEAGESRPFSIAGLATTYLRIGARHGPVGWLATSVVLRSPVGDELSLGVDVLVWKGGRFGAGFGAAVDQLRIGGFESSSLLRATASVVMTLGAGAVIGYSIEGQHTRDLGMSGADVRIHAATPVAARLRVVGGVHVSRSGVVDVAAGIRLRIVDALAGGVGYDSATGSVHAFATVRARALGVSVGASSHPVLGVSKRILLSWGVP